LNKNNDKTIMQKKKKDTNREEKGMKNSYLYRVLSVGRELKKNKINEKELLKHLKDRKIRRK
jgi:hypothetical protein